MKLRNKIFKKKRQFYVVCSLILFLILLNSCLTLRKTDKQINRIFNKKGQTIKIYHETIDEHNIRYIIDKEYNKNLKTILFVHGAPGSLTDYIKYFQDTILREKANLITVDRLGYGFSEYGKPETSIAKQAIILNKITEKFDNNKTILVGWSYGGPIIAKMAIENPNYQHLVLLAPAVSPNDEKYFWIGNFAKWKTTKWLVPTPFVVAEAEKLSHQKELEKLEKEWQKLKTPITYFHGDKDMLVPYENLSYLKLKIDTTILKTITLKGKNHFIPFTEFDKIKKALIKLLDK
ncbi:MAG TPA: alpha/beta fold hydrolase [Flavobacteriia bacterium]|jgi:pimeloyl-ACP methyl ester carboxylesterase|nr:alpha/beta fold hydrolase [Flavobacteriia bacterium]